MSQLRVFISYRRSDTQHVAGRLGDRLGSRFRLFMDIDDIPLGVDFTAVVRQAVDDSDVLLVLIGAHFLEADASGRRRLDAPGDWVATEVGTGLQRGITVIPVLVDGAAMPEAAELPDAVKPLVLRQAFRLTHASFNGDVDRLIRELAMIRPDTGAEVSDQPLADTLFDDPDYSRAVTAAFQQHWADAVELFEGLDRRFPKDERVGGPLTDARRSLDVERLSAAAAEAEASGRWRRAVSALEELRMARPEDVGLSHRLEVARREARIADLIGQIKALHRAGEWAGVAAIGRELAAVDPARADPDGLVTQAASIVADRDLSTRYASGLGQLSNGETASALATFEAIAVEQPDFRDSAQLVAMIRERLGPVASTPTAVAPIAAPPARLLAESPLGWLVVVGAVAFVVVVQIMLGPNGEGYYSSPASDAVILQVILAGVVLLIRDLRRMRSAEAARWRTRTLIGAGLGLLIPPVSLPALRPIAATGIDLESTLVLNLMVLPTVAAIVLYLVLRGRSGPAALWPAVFVLFGGVCGVCLTLAFIHLTR